MRIIVMFSLVLVSCGLFAQQTTPAIFQVYVYDTQNNPVPNYQVLIRPGRSQQLGEYIFYTDQNGYVSDTLDFYESSSNPGFLSISYTVLDSIASGVFLNTSFASKYVTSANMLMDTIKFKLQKPVLGVDNCGTYSAQADSVVNDPMQIRFRNNLNRLSTGAMWVYGDGDTGRSVVQSFHRYTTPGTYYYCFSTDSCAPVCDSVTVPTQVPVCIVKPSYHFYNFSLNGADVVIDNNYPSYVLDSVKWTFPNGPFPSSTNWTYTQYMPTGTYYYCVEVNDCPIVCDSIIVNQNCSADFNIKPVNGNFVVEELSTPIPNDSLSLEYHWDFGDGTSSADPHPSHIYINPGNYDLCLQIKLYENLQFFRRLICMSEHCETITTTNPLSNVNIEDGDLSFSDAERIQHLRIFPNPAEDWLQITNTEKKAVEAVIIYDLGGHEVMTFQNQTEQSHVQVSVAALPRGVYLIKIKTESGIQASKFVKE